MHKLEFTPSKSPRAPSCTIHKGEEYNYICFDAECHQRLLCHKCTQDQTHSAHQKSIFKVDDYLKELSLQSSEDTKEAADSLAKLLNTQAALTEKLKESQESSEREVLDFFDDLKYEFSKILDYAYEKEIKKIRRYHEKQTAKLSKEFIQAGKLLNLHSSLAQGNISKPKGEADLIDLANTLDLINKQSSLSVSLKLELKNLEVLLKNEVETQIMKAELDMLNNKKKELSDLLIDNFSIKDYYKKTDSTDSTKFGSAKSQKGSYSSPEGQILSLAVINAEQIATAGFDKVIKVWNLKTGECSLELAGHYDAILDLKAGFEGKYLFSASEDMDIRVWNIEQQKCKKVMSAHKAPVTSLCIISGKKMMVSGSKEGALLVWDLNNKKVKFELEGHDSSINAIRYAHRDQVITAADDGNLRVWNVKVGGLIKTIHVSDESLTSLSVFGRGQRVVAGDTAGKLNVWDIEQGKQIMSIRAHKKSVWAASISEDGTLIASGGGDKTFKLWDLSTGALLKQVEENESAVQCVEFLDTTSVLYCDVNPKKYKFKVFEGEKPKIA